MYDACKLYIDIAADPHPARYSMGSPFGKTESSILISSLAVRSFVLSAKPHRTSPAVSAFPSDNQNPSRGTPRWILCSAQTTRWLVPSLPRRAMDAEDAPLCPNRCSPTGSRASADANPPADASPSHRSLPPPSPPVPLVEGENACWRCASFRPDDRAGSPSRISGLICAWLHTSRQTASRPGKTFPDGLGRHGRSPRRGARKQPRRAECRARSYNLAGRRGRRKTSGRRGEEALALLVAEEERRGRATEAKAKGDEARDDAARLAREDGRRARTHRPRWEAILRFCKRGETMRRPISGEADVGILCKEAFIMFVYSEKVSANSAESNLARQLSFSLARAWSPI